MGGREGGWLRFFTTSVRELSQENKQNMLRVREQAESIGPTGFTKKDKTEEKILRVRYGNER